MSNIGGPTTRNGEAAAGMIAQLGSSYLRIG